MKLARLSGLVAGFTLLALLGGCAPTKSVDYSAFKQAKPRSILVLPPLNESPDVKATYSMLSQVTFPLAEAGYYVVPVALADETFRQNGLTSAGDVHQVSPAKLREIYGADAALYVTVSDYGTRYMVIRAPGLRGRLRGLGASRREGLGRCVALGHVLADQVVEQRPDGAPLVQPQAADGLELQAQVFR